MGVSFLFILWPLSKPLRIPSSMNKPWLGKIWSVLSSSQACCGGKVKGQYLNSWRKRRLFWPWNFTLSLTFHLCWALFILLFSNHIKYSIQLTKENGGIAGAWCLAMGSSQCYNVFYTCAKLSLFLRVVEHGASHRQYYEVSGRSQMLVFCAFLELLVGLCCLFFFPPEFRLLNCAYAA